MHDDYQSYEADCMLTQTIKFMLADDVLCMLSQLHDYKYTEGDANLYDPDEKERVIELINSWIYEYK